MIATGTNNRGKALIVGAGIGGLTTAIALRQAGYDVSIFERASELKPAGAGLTLAPNAGMVLRALDLLDQVAERGAVIISGEQRNPRGKLLQQAPIGTIAREFGVPMIGLLRSELQDVLVSNLESNILHLGMECVGFYDSGDRVVARFGDGTERSGDLLVGADGLNSAIRRQLLGGEETRYSGYTSWRAVVDTDDAAFATGVNVEVWGRGRRFGWLPIGQKLTYWFATENAPPDSNLLDKQRLVSRFANWYEPIPTLIGATDERQLIQTDIVDRRPTNVWGTGRVTLLGDAAHPTTPNLGQGACLAIEDSIVLSRFLVQHVGAVDQALRAYERARQSRTANITNLSLRFGQIAQLQSPFQSWARDFALRLIPTGVSTRQFRQLIQPDVPLREALDSLDAVRPTA